MVLSNSDDPSPEQWNDLRYFLAIAEGGSIKRAAAMLGSTQATVSKRLRSFEQWIGGRVFIRGTDGCALTDLGERLLPNAFEARKCIALLRRDAKDSGGSVQGDCRILVADGVASLWLAQFMPSFLERHPNIELKVSPDQDITAPRSDSFDIRIHFYDPGNSDQVSRPLATVHYALFASKSYLQKHGTPQTSEALSEHRLLDLAQYQTRTASWAAWSGGNVVKNVSILTNQTSFFERCLHFGAGIALAPTYHALGDPDLVALPLAFRLPGKLYISYNRVHAAKPAVKSTLAFLRETVFVPEHMPWFREEFEAPRPEWERMHREWMKEA
ncbi:MAG: LysR family transcriptional regulator [bacterium]